jgi:diaminopimelate epimerase
MDFLKMQGAGNDFVLIDGLDSFEGDWSELARRMCDRHFGIGADGLLLALPSDEADYRMAMWNPDGSESEMCGNGIRCFARYLLDGPGRGHDKLRIETGAGVLTVRSSGAWLQASMGRPVSMEMDRALPELGITVTCVSMGNPHAVHFVDDVAAVDLASLGPRVERHSAFPNRTNFHVCQVVSRSELVMRSWERGAGLTMACGTGASAAAVAARIHGYTEDVVRVGVPGGELELSWDGAGEVFMSGPAEYVFRGEWLDG